MTKDECIEVVDLFAASWNRDKPDKPMYLAWWRYLEPFQQKDALQALDWFVARGGFPPRISDVYRRTFDYDSGTAPLGRHEALEQAHSIVEANNRGLQTPEMHGLVKQTLESMSKKRIPWSSKAFEEEYDQQLGDHYAR